MPILKKKPRLQQGSHQVVEVVTTWPQPCTMCLQGCALHVGVLTVPVTTLS